MQNCNYTRVVEKEKKYTDSFITCNKSPIGLHHCEKKVSTPSLTCCVLKGAVFIVNASGAMKDLQASLSRS